MSQGSEESSDRQNTVMLMSTRHVLAGYSSTYSGAPLVFVASYFGPEVIRMASVSGRFSIRTRPYSAPITLTAVAKASASVAFLAMIVTLERPSELVPVLRSIMWLRRFPSIRTNCR